LADVIEKGFLERFQDNDYDSFFNSSNSGDISTKLVNKRLRDLEKKSDARYNELKTKSNTKVDSKRD
jgi:hypothetical protein